MLNFAGKVLSGLVSMTMMMFSSYEGNNADFSQVLIGHNENAIRIRTNLVNAFENDFEPIFRSGSPIVISYTLIVKRDNSVIARDTYQNRILFDPMNRYFQIEAQAANHFTFVETCEELRLLISEVDIFYDHWNISGTYHFQLSAHMDNVNLASLEREFDLMMLWHHKTPAISFSYTVEPYES
jgi:hypothetical protein